MNATIFIANGTEDTEFVCTRDLLIRAGIDVRVLSVNNPTVTLSHGLIVLADGLLSDYVSSDILILPGGKKGVNEFLNNDSLINILKKEYKNNKIICAICAAPVVLYKVGLLSNKNYTCYDGFEKEILDGKYTKTSVIRDSNIITGRSLNYTIDFALEIIEYTMGTNVKERIEKGILKIC